MTPTAKQAYLTEGLWLPSHLPKAINNSQCCLNCSFSFKNRGQHIEPALSKCRWSNLTELEFVEVVKIFDQFSFLIFVKFKNVSEWTLFRIILHSLINLFSLNTIERCHICINQHGLVPQIFIRCSTSFVVTGINSVFISLDISLLFLLFLIISVID